jgi:hypothetical protein
MDENCLHFANNNWLHLQDHLQNSHSWNTILLADAPQTRVKKGKNKLLLPISVSCSTNSHILNWSLLLSITECKHRETRILDLRTIKKTSIFDRLYPLQKDTSVLTGQDTAWAPQLVWMLWREKLQKQLSFQCSTKPNNGRMHTRIIVTTNITEVNCSKS